MGKMTRMLPPALREEPAGSPSTQFQLVPGSPAQLQRSQLTLRHQPSSAAREEAEGGRGPASSGLLVIQGGGRRAEGEVVALRGCSAKESLEPAAWAPRPASVCSGANSAEEPGRSAAQSGAAAAAS